MNGFFWIFLMVPECATFIPLDRVCPVFHGQGKNHIVSHEWVDYRPHSPLQYSGVDLAKEAEEWTFPRWKMCLKLVILRSVILLQLKHLMTDLTCLGPRGQVVSLMWWRWCPLRDAGGSFWHVFKHTVHPHYSITKLTLCCHKIGSTNEPHLIWSRPTFGVITN